jgi:cytochrome c oxidase subunit III
MNDAVAVAVADPDLEPVPLAHHFDDPEQQRDSALLGMWAFLATEVMFFGGVLTAYTVYRVVYPAEFAAASHFGLDLWIGGFNTLVLLGSSLAVALAVHASQSRRGRATVGFLLLTIVLGASFLGIKAYEWSVEIHEGLFPGPRFHFEHGDGLDVRKVELFFFLYFFMTGLHALHMIIGLVILGIIAAAIRLGRLPASGERQVEITGLYWHFVDIVWVFLYPLLYLIHSRA